MEVFLAFSGRMSRRGFGKRSIGSITFQGRATAAVSVARCSFVSVRHVRSRQCCRVSLKVNVSFLIVGRQFRCDLFHAVVRFFWDRGCQLIAFRRSVGVVHESRPSAQVGFTVCWSVCFRVVSAVFKCSLAVRMHQGMFLRFNVSSHFRDSVIMFQSCLAIPRHALAICGSSAFLSVTVYIRHRDTDPLFGAVVLVFSATLFVLNDTARSVDSQCPKGCTAILNDVSGNSENLNDFAFGWLG